MIFKLIQNEGHVWTALEVTILVLSPVLGVFITRLILLLLVKPRKITLLEALSAIFKFWTAK